MHEHHCVVTHMQQLHLVMPLQLQGQGTTYSQTAGLALANASAVGTCALSYC
jgi:hypothetical protein